MGLREEAAADFHAITTDADDFGWPITVTDPAGASQPLVGFANDISQAIDPETGQIVSGRFATIALSIRALTAAGLGLPVGISDSKTTPWTVQFTDPSLNAFLFKVSKTDPDRSIESVVCFLELFKAA